MSTGNMAFEKTNMNIIIRLRTVLKDFARQTAAIVYIEAKKIWQDPTELFTRAVQPVLWLGVFGQVMSRARAIPTGDMSYIDFVTPGILAQSALFIAIFYGISLIWERDLGILHKYLSTPAYRGALVSAKAVSAGIRACSQAVIVYVLAYIMGVHLRLAPLPIAGVFVFIILGAAVFSTFSLVIACIVKTRERFMGIGQILTMPLFFASNAIYPISLMPGWLKVLSRINPLTYQVDALRMLMVQNGKSTLSLVTDFYALVMVLIILIVVGSKLYPKAIT
jgi:ABC-2 type transport system permease protein